MRRLVSLLVVLPALAFGFGCQGGLEDARSLPALDEPYFRCRVQPVLTKSCASFTCHGDAKRFFHVFARNRLRLSGTEKDRNAPLSPPEHTANFDAARAFVEETSRDESLLLTKPLDVVAGGSFHRGATLFAAGNVFTDKKDPDYQTLADWVAGGKEDAACVEPGSDQ
jgi:hypothetical protein